MILKASEKAYSVCARSMMTEPSVASPRIVALVLVAERRCQGSLVPVRQVREPHFDQGAPVLVGLRVEEEIHVAEHERSGARRKQCVELASVRRVELVHAEIHEPVDREGLRFAHFRGVGRR
jgi:hypothetical protein